MTSEAARPVAILPPHPVDMLPLGRFVLPVPRGMETTATWFEVNKIAVEELPWQAGADRRGLDALRESMGPPAGLAGRGEESDVSDLCGFPALFHCNQGNMADHNRELHIGLPKVVLRLTENRPFDICGPSLSIDGPLLDLLRRYRFGSGPAAPDSFFTAAGRIEGLKTWSEHAGVSLERPPAGPVTRIRLRLATHLFASPCDPPRIKQFVRSVTSKYRISLELLRSRDLPLAGLPGFEEVYILWPRDSEEIPRMTACWVYEGAGGDPEKPHVELKLTCRAEAREEALAMWEAIVANFTSVRRRCG